MKKFVGRRDLLQDISNAFAPLLSNASKDVESTSLALIGMGGIGETQIVLEYCMRARKQFHSVFWIYAKSDDTINNSFLKIAEAMGLPAQLSSLESYTEFVFEAWKTWPGPCLVVYDNVDDPDIGIQSFLPQIGPLAVLITSRLRSAGEIADKSVDVAIMDEGEAIELLLARAELPTPASESPDDIDSKEVVRVLGYLPLALDQASSYIRQQKVSLRMFLDYYEREKLSILQHIPHGFWQYKEYGSAGDRQRYLSVITTWEMSLKLFASADQGQERIIGTATRPKVAFLTLAAFLGGHRASKVLFKSYVQNMASLRGDGEVVNPLADWARLFQSGHTFDDARYRNIVVQLSELSLIQNFCNTGGDDFYFSVHSVVQEWARQRPDMDVNTPETRAQYSQEALKVLECVLEKYGAASKPWYTFRLSDMLGTAGSGGDESAPVLERCREMMIELTAHVRSCLKHATTVGPALNGSLSVEQHIAAFLDVSDMEMAKEMWSRILQYHIAQYGPIHEKTLAKSRLANSCRGASLCPELWEIGEAMEKSGDGEGATVQQDTLESIARTALTFATIGTLNGAGNLFLPAGPAAAEAKELLVEYRDSFFKLFDRCSCYSSSVLCSALQIAYTLLLSDERDRAREVLEMVQLLLPEDQTDPKTVEAHIFHSGLQLFLLHKTEQDEDCRRFAGAHMAKYAKEHARDYWAVALPRLILINIYKKNSEWKAAVSEAEQLRTFFYHTIGPLDVNTLACSIVIAVCQFRGGEIDSNATKSTIYELLDTHHSRVGAKSLAALALDKVAATYFQEAGLHRYCFELMRQICQFGREVWDLKDHFVIAAEEDCVLSLTKVLDRTPAEVVEMKQLLEARQHSPSLHPDWAEKLCEFLWAVGCYEDVLQLYSSRLECKAILNYTDDDPELTQSRAIAASYRFLGRWTEAGEWYSAIVDARRTRNTEGLDPPEPPFDLFYYAEACAKTEMWAKAVKSFRAVLAHRQKILGRDHERTVEVMMRLTLPTWKLGYHSESLDLWREIVLWYERTHGSSSDATMDCYFLRAQAHSYQAGEHRRAIELFSQVAAHRRQALGEKNLQTLEAVWAIGNEHCSLLEREAAAPYLLESCQAFLDCRPRPQNIAFRLEQARVLAIISRQWDRVEKMAEGMLACAQEGLQLPPSLDMALLRGRVGIPRLLLGRAAEAEDDLAAAVAFAREQDTSSIRSALSAFWYAESQTLLGNHAVAVEYYSFFYSYDGDFPTEQEDYMTYGRGWKALKDRAREYLGRYEEE